MAETFSCEYCRQTFEKTRSDDEMDAEARALFGTVHVFTSLSSKDPDMAVVCDECFKAMGFDGLVPTQGANQ
jgi:hypothetical protein